jgi:PhnB protein
MAKAATKPKAEKAAPATAGKASKPKWDSRKLHTVTPHLVCANAAKAIDFYVKAFGAEEMMRLEGPDGSLWHASVRIGDSAVMLVDEMPGMGSLGPKALKGTTVTIHLNVPDADAAIKRAAKAGAKVLMPAADMFWGDRYGVIEDPFGHKWSIATHVRAMTVDQIKAAMPKGEM